MSDPKRQHASTRHRAEENQTATTKRHLDAINDFLAARGLRGATHIATERGATQLIRPTGLVTGNAWNQLVEFEVLHPDKTTGFYMLRFHARGSDRREMIVIPMIDDQLIFIRQHRVAACFAPSRADSRDKAWMTEAPRAFAANRGKLTVLDRKLMKLAQVTHAGRELPYHALPLGLLGQKMTQLMIEDNLDVVDMVRLSEGSLQDSGFDTAEPEIWLVQMTHPQTHTGELARRIRGTRAMGIRFYALREVKQRRAELGINDLLTIGALCLLYEHLGCII